MPETKERWRNQLPHWEVKARPHFITIRCAGSLPLAAQQRIREITASLAQIAPASPEFARLQRQYFLTCEKYLDHPGQTGFAPFKTESVANLVLNELRNLDQHSGWKIIAATVMPNHLHVLTERTSESETRSLREMIRNVKGRIARLSNLELGRKGPFWQRDWFDRWMRDEQEVTRTRQYIRANPVKAGLVKRPEDWPWQI